MITQKLKSFALALCLVSLLSCSHDDLTPSDQKKGSTSNDNRPIPNQPEARALRLKRVVQVTNYSSTDSDTFVTDYIYTGNILTSTRTIYNDNVYDAQYHYEGLKLTLIDNFENGTATGQTIVHYNGNQLSYVLSGENQNERSEYTYSGGHVQSVSYYYPAGQPNEHLTQSETYTYLGDNVAQKLSFVNFGGTARTTYTYDGKNNPLKNMNKYYRLLSVQEGFTGLSLNNAVTWAQYFPAESTTSQNQYVVMEYNSSNYPTSIKRFYEGSNFLTSDTTITYE